MQAFDEPDTHSQETDRSMMPLKEIGVIPPIKRFPLSSQKCPVIGVSCQGLNTGSSDPGFKDEI
jgi:hypothetical protein